MLLSKKTLIFIIFIFFLVLTLVSFLIINLSKTKPALIQPTPTLVPFPTSNLFPNQTSPSPPEQFINFKGIIPGQDTEEEVKRRLGDPIRTGEENLFKIIIYPTKENYIVNKIYILDGKVKYIVESTTSDYPEKYNDFLRRFPNGPDGVVYDPQNRGFKWYVFSRNGFSVFTNSGGYVFNIQYFIPMSFEDYLKTLAKDFSLTTQEPKANF